MKIEVSKRKEKKYAKLCKATLIITHFVTNLSFQLLHNHRILQHISPMQRYLISSFVFAWETKKFTVLTVASFNKWDKYTEYYISAQKFKDDCKCNFKMTVFYDSQRYPLNHWLNKDNGFFIHKNAVQIPDKHTVYRQCDI